LHKVSVTEFTINLQNVNPKPQYTSCHACENLSWLLLPWLMICHSGPQHWPLISANLNPQISTYMGREERSNVPQEHGKNKHIAPSHFRCCDPCEGQS